MDTRRVTFFKIIFRQRRIMNCHTFLSWLLSLYMKRSRIQYKAKNWVEFLKWTIDSCFSNEALFYLCTGGESNRGTAVNFEKVQTLGVFKISSLLGCSVFDLTVDQPFLIVRPSHLMKILHVLFYKTRCSKHDVTFCQHASWHKRHLPLRSKTIIIVIYLS